MFLSTDIYLPGTMDLEIMQSGFLFMLVLEKWEKCGGHQQFFTILTNDVLLMSYQICEYNSNFTELTESRGQKQRAHKLYQNIAA